jgi:hypothetical protein
MERSDPFFHLSQEYFMKPMKRYFFSAACAVAALTAPSAHADVCGSGLALPANVWTMFSAPCAPPAGSATVNDQFNADLGTGAAYNTTWIMFKWDPNAGTAGEYVPLAGTDPLEQDTGYWIFSTTGGTLKIDNGTHTTGDMKMSGTDDGYYGDCAQFGWTGQPCYKIDLAVPTAAEGTKWNLVGYPFVRSTPWADVHVAKSTDDGSSWTDVGGPSAADSAGLISKNGYVYNESGSSYNTFDDTVSSPSDNTLQPNKSYWIKSRYVAGEDRIALLVPAPRYLMFQTSSVYTGNLGGLNGADTLCQAQATAGGLTDQYMAWLSDQSTEAKDRIDHAGPYHSTQGVTIAQNWQDLTDGSWLVYLNVDEAGVSLVGSKYPWTGTTPSGQSTGEDCNGWNSEAVSYSGTYGLSTQRDGYWSEWATSNCSDTGGHTLICMSTD